MFEELERQGFIKKFPVDQRTVLAANDLACRDLKTARIILVNDNDWAYTIAYNAVLQAGRALMFSRGYRPAGANQHISVVKFSGLFLQKKDAIIFDRMRRKRNNSVYDIAGSITLSEAEFAVNQAEILVKIIEAFLLPARED
ncbi:MAG: HEPN domain-containing protein [Methanocalculus sp.]|uniref:HEPN domain-containing protein n=1 Tax=Methanocalculus sp. TaxID=2004547 RepID=UPI002722BC93|nr:HEPN domain-containing protein [Methanocalculus sp.]MDO9539942.1 HEPN domain-containing protein [Methanocalculus sp.]